MLPVAAVVVVKVGTTYLIRLLYRVVVAAAVLEVVLVSLLLVGPLRTPEVLLVGLDFI